MRTVRFKKILDGVLSRMGEDPDVNVSAATKAAVARYISERHQESWEGHDWPETRLVEERVYRVRWDDVVTVDIEVGDIVFHEDEYWSALVAATTEEPDALATEWEVADAYERYVALDQEGETLISEVVAVWDANPRVGFAEQVPFELTENGAQVDDTAPDTVWVEFSLRVPEFTSEEWAAGTVYAVNDVVLYTDGECYAAVQAHSGQAPSGILTDYWARQTLLYVLSRYVERAAYADTLSEDGQQAKGDRELGLAYRALEDELVKTALKQGQTRRYVVRTA